MDKPWKLMTAADILKIKREKCQYCLYATRYGTDDRNLSVMTCDYIGITGHRRGCRPDRCDKFQEDPKTKRRKGRALRVNRRRGGSSDKGKAESVQGTEKRDKDTG
ncbi:hypothetical protein MR857_13295 [bacterium]|nr:hypothetical protein [bacterium]MDY3022381.1 hypothetical protein [Oliverpabstia sp.]